MKKWAVCIVLLLELSLLCSCQKPDNAIIESPAYKPGNAVIESSENKPDNAIVESSENKPAYPELTYSFVPDSSGAHMFDICEVNPDGSDVNQVTNTVEGSYATFPSWRPASVRDDVSESIIADPYTHTENQLGSGRTFSLCNGDFNGDGLPDVFVTTYEGESGLYLKTSKGYELSPFHFSTAEENSHGVAAGDLDRDGDLDLFLVNNSAGNHVFFNDGSGNFALSDEIYGHTDGHGLQVKLADMDSDGDLDAIVPNYLRPVQLLQNDGLGHFTSSDFGTFDTETIQVLIADFNQDGAMDAYFVNQNRQDQMAMNDGKGNMTMMPELYGEAVSWGNASTGDMNGDGYTDVVVANEEMGAGIWLNDQTGKLLKSGKYIGNSSTNMLLEDLDEDGDLDMVVMSVEKGVELYLNDGASNFTFLKSLENATGAVSAMVMDFDDDGHLDIIIGRMTGGNRIYYYQ